MTALAPANLVKETSITAGTGTWTLAGAVSGFRAWSNVGDTNTAFYEAQDGLGNWEIGIGTYTLSGTTLARSVLISSNANALVNFTTTVTIACVDVIEVRDQIITLTSAYTATASSTATQKLFNSSPNGAVTLPVGTYEFECWFTLTGLSSGTGTFGFALIAGTAIVGACSYVAHSNKATIATPAAPTSCFIITNAITAISASNAATVGWAYMRGTFTITTAGTLIPSFNGSVNVPANAPVVGAGSFFKVKRVGSNTEKLVGPNWS